VPDHAPTPAPDPSAEYMPTEDDLRDIADFICRRSLDEAGQAGMMQSNRDHGVTIRVDVPKDGHTAEYRDQTRELVTRWLDEHSPDRFLAMSYQLSELANRLADAGYDCRQHPTLSTHRVQAVWRTLTKAAHLWEQHPDFKPLWTKED